MKLENLAYLQGNLKYLGFGENMLLNEQLEQAISKEPAEFQLYTEAFFDEYSKVEAVLYFRKSTQLGMYFFNKYDVLLRMEGEPQKDKQQTFYISKGTGVTFKEAFNLLQGRAVYKKLTDREGAEYHAWLQLKFDEKEENNNHVVRKFGARYGYDLERTLEKYPIKELKYPDQKANLLRSLQRGNVQPVTFDKINKLEKMLIEANPQYKTINIYPRSAIIPPRTGNRKSFATSEKDNPTGEANCLPSIDDKPTPDERVGPESIKEEEIVNPEKRNIRTLARRVSTVKAGR